MCDCGHLPGVVELVPQEDAMLRSRMLLRADDHHPKFHALAGRVRVGREGFLFLAAMGVLIASGPTLAGQTDGSFIKGQQADPQAQICDGLKQPGSQRLSLGTSKGRLIDADETGAEQQPVSQSGPESTGRDLRLPQGKLSSSAKEEQEVQCKKKTSATDMGSSADPSPAPAPSATPEPAPKAPTVSYVGGMLTINAENVSLRDVIDGIRAHTGIFVEYPAESLEDRVFDHVGPAPLRDALAQFLYGSKLNYVLQTSYSDPQKVTRLILSSQPRLASAGPQPRVNRSGVDQQEPPAVYGGSGFADETPEEPVAPVPPPNLPARAATTTLPGIPEGFNVQQAAAASGKTTGQILDEMQKRLNQALDDQAPPPPQP
jgi:hypothetical protein